MREGTPNVGPRPTPAAETATHPQVLTASVDSAAPIAAPSSAASSAASSEPPRPTTQFTLSDDLERAIEVYPPLDDAPKSPLVVMLHATCMQPASVCDAMGDAGRDVGWLVCPSGNSTCYGEPDWNGPAAAKASFLERAIDRVEAAIPSFVDERPGVLVGWSRGAFAARDILYASASDPKFAALSQRFRGLVLIAAMVKPDPKALQSAGITRVVLAAGDYDMSLPIMLADVPKLKKAGLEARFVSLGKIGHVWPPDFDARMREPIDWAAGNGAP